MNIDKLSIGEKLLGACTALLLLLSFLSIWAKYEAGGFAVRFSAWSEAYGIVMKLALILAIVALGIVVARLANVSMSIPFGDVYLGLTGASLLLFLLAFLMGPEEGAGLAGIEVSRGFGFFLGLLLAAGAAAGAWMHRSAAPATATPPTAGPGTV